MFVFMAICVHIGVHGAQCIIIHKATGLPVIMLPMCCPGASEAARRRRDDLQPSPSEKGPYLLPMADAEV